MRSLLSDTISHIGPAKQAENRMPVSSASNESRSAELASDINAQLRYTVLFFIAKEDFLYKDINGPL